MDGGIGGTTTKLNINEHTKKNEQSAMALRPERSIELSFSFFRVPTIDCSMAAISIINLVPH
jgi:hypothetical protein